MIELAREFLLDEKYVRATLLGLAALGGAYWQSPAGRTWQDRLVNAMFVVGPIRLAAIRGGKSTKEK